MGKAQTVYRFLEKFFLGSPAVRRQLTIRQPLKLSSSESLRSDLDCGGQWAPCSIICRSFSGYAAGDLFLRQAVPGFDVDGECRIGLWAREKPVQAYTNPSL